MGKPFQMPSGGIGRLKGSSNHANWKATVEMRLQSEGVWGYVDGTETESPQPLAQLQLLPLLFRQRICSHWIASSSRLSQSDWLICTKYAWTSGRKRSPWLLTSSISQWTCPSRRSLRPRRRIPRTCGLRLRSSLLRRASPTSTTRSWPSHLYGSWTAITWRTIARNSRHSSIS